MAGTQRTIEATMPAMPASDGAGVRLKRSIGTPALDHLDPFLMLDQFDTENADDYIAGFPEHPPRGFETAPRGIQSRVPTRTLVTSRMRFALTRTEDGTPYRSPIR